MMAGHDELQSGSSVPEEDAWLLDPHAHEGGISRAYSTRLADEILSEPHPAPAPTPGPRRNRHLNGDGYGEGR